MRLLAVLCLVALLAACWPGAAERAPAALPKLVLYNWEDEIPASVLAAFTAQSGIAVEYVAYDSTEAAVANLRAGASYDVVMLENRYVGVLIDEGLLAPLDLHKLPNFKNIPLNFRDLSFDPGNRYSIPWSWGTAGIVARTDLPVQPAAWADLWNPEYCGGIAMWRGQTREMVSLTLKMLGYSANSEDPAQLSEAEARLLALRPCVRFVDDIHVTDIVATLRGAGLVAGLGYAYEAVQIRELGIPVELVLPAEGALLWTDSIVAPASSHNPGGAEALIDFLLRAEVSAEIVNTKYYQLANDAAQPLIAPELREDPMLYPPTDALRHTEILLPLSEEGERRYAAIGEAFLAATP